MTPEEAQRDFDERVARGKRRIDEMRKARTDAHMRDAQ
jgi:hypothetical protein